MKSHRGILVLAIVLGFAILIFKNKIEVDVSMATASSAVKESDSRTVPVRSSLKNKISITSNHIKTAKWSVDTTDTSTLTAEQTAVLCKLKSLRTNVPIDGDVQIYVDQNNPFFGAELGNVAWIKSKSCPEGMYSVVQFSDEGTITREADCRKSTVTEISALSGEQGNIIEQPSRDGVTSIAITGNGYFVLSCPSGGLILTRDGRFQQNSEGNLVNENNCALLSQQGTSFHGFGMDFSGCNSNGDCVATVDPSVDEISGLDYINSYSFQAENISQLTESITRKGPAVLRPSFFINAVEDIHSSERGLTSVSWSHHPHINLNNLRCNP